MSTIERTKKQWQEHILFQYCYNIISSVVPDNIQQLKLKERLNSLLPEEINH
ncbi:MAG: hypothetical protein PHG79_02715 [Methanosarcina sp.]|nr:hypothetical protein [Methanosarcina sp.]MDD3872683.1 hypothetical protein [Methanosarcina sp.]MDD4521901.1 hypothetical protein [Methanosarcina sp.]HHV23161.1 hypothetical protein [Methanosarcina sp.]